MSILNINTVPHMDQLVSYQLIVSDKLQDCLQRIKEKFKRFSEALSSSKNSLICDEVASMRQQIRLLERETDNELVDYEIFDEMGGILEDADQLDADLDRLLGIVAKS